MTARHPLSGALTAWQRDFARSFAAAVPMEPAANEPDPDSFRWIAIAGVPGTAGYVREIIAADYQVEAEEKAETLHALALSLGLPFALRPLTCRDPEAAPARVGEHDLRFVDPMRDDMAKIGHWQCARCGRCEHEQADFNG